MDTSYAGCFKDLPGRIGVVQELNQGARLDPTGETQVFNRLLVKLACLGILAGLLFLQFISMRCDLCCDAILDDYLWGYGLRRDN